ncbi:hypothetical protein HHI36_005181, partial [Cryptolaemus montrouzieri]
VPGYAKQRKTLVVLAAIAGKLTDKVINELSLYYILAIRRHLDCCRVWTKKYVLPLTIEVQVTRIHNTCTALVVHQAGLNGNRPQTTIICPQAPSSGYQIIG